MSQDDQGNSAMRDEIAQLREWRDNVSKAIKRSPEFEPGEWAGDKEGWGYHFEIVQFLHRDRAALQARQQELLATIVKVSNTTPFADEAKDALEQRGKLLAEIGTLRSEVEAHRRTLDEKLGAWQVSKELGDARWEARRLTEQLAAMTAARDELARIAAIGESRSDVSGSQLSRIAELKKVGGSP